jgi:hypothetical protein
MCGHIFSQLRATEKKQFEYLSQKDVGIQQDDIKYIFRHRKELASILTDNEVST